MKNIQVEGAEERRSERLGHVATTCTLQADPMKMAKEDDKVHIFIHTPPSLMSLKILHVVDLP